MISERLRSARRQRANHRWWKKRGIARPPDARGRLVRQMTLDEKVSMLHAVGLGGDIGTAGVDGAEQVERRTRAALAAAAGTSG
jgi:hypothetical protein